MSDFDQSLPIILEEEGGWYDGSQAWDPNPTMHGITQATYDAYRGRNELPAQSVQLISDAEVDAIYYGEYWVPSHADALSWPLSLFHFDFYVNTRPERAIATLQRTLNKALNLNLGVDGAWGPQTASAVAMGLPQGAPRMYLLERIAEYDDIVKHDPGKATPLVKEWIPRVVDLYRRFA